LASKEKTSAATSAEKPRERKWTTPSKRAKSFAEERKAKVHMYGPKEGQELTDYEAGLRSGYLMCQSDHAGQHIYKEALAEGKTKKEAGVLSRIIGYFRNKKKEGNV